MQFQSIESKINNILTRFKGYILGGLQNVKTANSGLISGRFYKISGITLTIDAFGWADGDNIGALLALSDLIGPEAASFEVCGNALERIFGPALCVASFILFSIFYGFSLLVCEVAHADGGGGGSSSRVARSHATAQS
jgi:hypothetical protein